MKILFISSLKTAFIQDDLDFLERHFVVRRQIGHGFIAAFKIVFRALFVDAVYCWFASTYAFVAVLMARILGLKSIVIVGGVDAAKDKSLGYGIWLSGWKAKLVRYVFRRANHILVVDPALKEESLKLAKYEGLNISCVPTGYDSNFWRPLSVKYPVVLTVASVRDKVTFRRKGIDTLIEAANILTDVQFIIVGTDPSLALQMQPPLNMRFHDAMPRKDLLPFYQQAKVYCQPSRREGLPNALCEGMLCGCIPVAAEVGGIPRAVGDTGILIPPGESDVLAAAILTALKVDDTFGMKARSRIVALFPKEKRESEIVRLITSDRG